MQIPTLMARAAAQVPAALALGSLLLASSMARAVDLTVSVTGLRSQQGSVMLALYNSAETFPKANRSVQAQMIPASQAGGTASFRNLPAGRYALAVFHDENGNGKLDMNLLGMPTEAYGFSNDAFGNAAAPSFDKAALDLGGDAVIAIKLR
jgi:uncharacterized protein (DUF2141 family)